MSQPSAENLSERHNALAAYQQQLLRESERRRYGLFAADMADCVGELCTEYFYMAQQPTNDRLYELLMTADMKNGEIKLARYSSDGIRRYFPLTDKNLAKFFSEDGIYYDRDAALLLLTRIRAIRQESANVLFKKRIHRFVQKSPACREAAELLLEMEPYFSWHDGHLIFLDPIQHKAFCGNDIANTDFLPLKLPKAESRRLFRYLSEKLKADAKLLSDEAALITDIDSSGADLVYSFFGKLYCIKHVAGGAPTLTACKLKPHHSVKQLRLYGNRSGDKAAEILRRLCGGSSDALSGFARLFADIAFPASRSSRLSVIYTRNAGFVNALLSKVYSTEAPVSANSLLTAKGKEQLLRKQLNGDALLLIKDKLPSLKRMPDFIALTNSGKLETDCETLGKQSFRSRMHVVCVTDSASVARHFADRYGAGLLDLSLYEQLCDLAMLADFGPEDGEWFKSVFTLHGGNIALSGNRRASGLGQREINQFIKLCCKISKAAVCEREELYKAYCEYYKTLHGCPPKESSVVFGKRFREHLPSGVEYKVKRYGTDNSTHLCYVGLGIDPAKQVHFPSLAEDAFDSQLAHMEQYAAQLLRQL